MNYFEALNSINVNEHTEKKNGLTYLSWAWAWGEVKKRHPDATYTVYKNADGWFYHTDGRTCWVETGVTIEGIEHIEYLPVMDYKNRSIPLEGVTSFDVNKAIQRSLTKAVARHGLGLYIYAGEDLPEGEEQPAAVKTNFVPRDFNKCSLDQIDQLLLLLEETNTDRAKVLKRYKAEKLEDLTDIQADKAIQILKEMKANAG